MLVVNKDPHLQKYRARLDARRNRAILEPLEVRALLSASLQITGHGHAIAFNDTKPSTFDATDFRQMSTTVDATVGTMFHTFTIDNNGDADLTSIQVTVTGPDFVLQSQPDATITDGGSSDFKINFIPQGTGTRTATVTVTSNDPLHPVFTFTIKGQGVATQNDSTNSFEVATLHSGTGTGALSQNGTVSGSTIMVDYTGYLLEGGTVFDSSVFENSDVRGHSPIQVTVGSGGVIPGFDEGLKGIKFGETRVLFIPAAIGYGDTGSGSIPPGATLVFVVTRRKPPTIGMAGLDQIGFGEAAPSPVDGTYLGTIPAGSTVHSLTQTFQIYQVSPSNLGNLNLTTTKVRLTGPQKSDFSSTLINFSTVSGVTFTITYAPAHPRTSSAVVHIGSTDPDHRDFVFTVGAAETPFNDLAASLGHISYPASGTITSGAANKYTFPVVVKNNGNVPVPKTPIDVKLQLHNTTSGQYTTISNFTTTFFQNLAPGKSRTLNLPLTVPIAVSAGTYDVFVFVDQTDALHEGVTDNNVGSTSQLVSIVQGTTGISGNLVGLSPLIPTIAANTPLSANLAVSLQNAGNLPLPKGQKVTLQAVAVDTNTMAQTTLGPLTSVSLSGWAGGRAGNFNAPVKLLGGLPAGTYNLIVTAASAPAVGGVLNFNLTTDGNSAPLVLTVT